MVSRATPRDLFDVSLIALARVPYDEELYRKLLIFYLCMTPDDVRGIRTDRVSDIDAYPS